MNKKNYSAPKLTPYGDIVAVTKTDCWTNKDGQDKTLFGPSDVWLLNAWGIEIISDCPTS